MNVGHKRSGSRPAKRSTCDGASDHPLHCSLVVLQFAVTGTIGLIAAVFGWFSIGVLNAQSTLSNEIPPASAESSAANGGPTINVWTHEGANTPAFAVLKTAAETFNRRQGVHKVNIFPSIYRYYEERVQSAAATGTLPCVLEIDGPFVQAFAWRGYLRSIDKFVTKELLGDLLPTIIIQGTYNGRLYTLGQFESGLGLWGNTRYLTRVGARIPTIQAPWSVTEFEQVLDRLTQLADVDYALNLAVYTGRSEFYSYAYAPILQGFGGDLIRRGTNPAAKGVLDGAQSVAAMKRFQRWFEKGWTQAVFDRADDFEKHRVALSWTGHWNYPSYRAALGQDLVLLPLPDFGHGIKTGMGSWSWGISSTCRDAAGAWAFLEHLMSTREIVRITKANGAVPARQSVVARSALYGDAGPLRIFAQQLNAGLGVPRPATPGYSTISRSFAGAVSEIITGKDVQMTLSEAARSIDADIARNRGYPTE
jgi:multiple sugar transport system substrate-binding protein